MTPNAWHLFALFIGTIVAIIGKAMPIGALSVIAIALVAITEVTNPGKPAAALIDALSGFANPLIWLIVVAVMVALSLTKTGLGTAHRLPLHLAAGQEDDRRRLRPGGVGTGHRAGHAQQHGARRRHHPPDHALDRRQLRLEPRAGHSSKIGRYLALVNYNANPITSAMFITATAPNPLCVELIAKATGSTIQITWGQWALAALLPCLSCCW